MQLLTPRDHATALCGSPFESYTLVLELACEELVLKLEAANHRFL